MTIIRTNEELRDFALAQYNDGSQITARIALDLAKRIQSDLTVLMLFLETQLGKTAAQVAPKSDTAKLSFEVANDLLIENLPGIGTRLRHALAHAGIGTIDQLRALTDFDLLCIPDVGRRSISRLRKIIHKNGGQVAPEA
jgi:DNA-directed RNA polymerase alpha subunit